VRANTELPRREGDAIRIPVVIEGPGDVRGEGARVITHVDSEWLLWDAYLKGGKSELGKSARADVEGHHDIAAEGHAYWTRGEGLAKWVKSPHPWTALYHHLLGHIKNVAEAKATAAKWHHEVLGFWPGAHHGGKHT
jgi:hypothetical protein